MKNHKGSTAQLNVLIVEDEIHAQKEIKRLLALCDYDVKILEFIDNIEDAISWINNNPNPDLMFFDIQMSDGMSFEIFNHINSTTPVIFTTAFNEFAIKAFKVNSIDYLLKPLKLNELNDAIKKYLSLEDKYGNKRQPISLDQIEQLFKLNKPSFKSRFIVKIGDQILHISIKDIAYFKSEDNVTLIVTRNNKRYIIDYPLEQITTEINPDHFHRINRSFIIHIDSIKKINKYFNSRLHIELEPVTSDHVLISRIKVPDFLKWIDK